jgi:hypothetical protein
MSGRATAKVQRRADLLDEIRRELCRDLVVAAGERLDHCACGMQREREEARGSAAAPTSVKVHLAPPEMLHAQEVGRNARRQHAGAEGGDAEPHGQTQHAVQSARSRTVVTT